MIRKILLIGVGCSLLATCEMACGAEQMIPLGGHIPLHRLQNAVKLNAVSPEEDVSLGLLVNIDSTLLNQTYEQIYAAPAPHGGRHFLTPAEFAERFGIADKRQQLKDFAVAKGLLVDPMDHSESMVVHVHGRATDVEKALHIHLNQYQKPDGRVFRSNDTDPLIPASLAPHLGMIVGLSNLTGIAHPHYRRLSGNPGHPAGTMGPIQSFAFSGATGPGGGLAPQDIKTIYGLNSLSLDGTGQQAALVELDGYAPSDITSYEAKFNLPAIPVTPISIDGTSNTAGPNTDEVVLDIEMIAALTPKISQIRVYEGPNSDQGLIDIYNQIASDGISSVSTSWGLDEADESSTFLTQENTIFQRMAVQGQTFYAAAGDCGAYDTEDINGNCITTQGFHVDNPASQPYITGVGGTTLQGSISSPSEITWNEGGGEGTGGGVSSVWALPSYQSGISGASSQQFRNVPDVSLNADPRTGYSVFVSGGWTVLGGTSAGAPLWAAFTALLNQERAADGLTSFGFANPNIYQLASGSSYGAIFNDITSGNNYGFNAGPGYDNATGWGSFKAGGFITAFTVTPPPSITQQPSNQSVGLGQPATFRIGASGSGLTYQWLEKLPGQSTFTAIAQATSSNYSTGTSETVNDQTQYECIVTNAGGSVTSQPATLTVGGEPNNLSNILIYPNPWDTRKHTGIPMHFTSLPEGASVKIYTVSAHWVRTLTASAGVANWDMTNDSGQPVASGYYLYLITDSQGHKTTGKLAVIR